MAPGIEVNPPRISTGNALSAMICSAKETSERAPHMMPVASATMPAVNHTITQICSSEMPTESAALWLSATARNARPTRVLWNTTPSVATMTSAIAAAAMSSLCSDTKPPSMLIWIAPLGRCRSSVIITLGSPPNTSSPNPMRK